MGHTQIHGFQLLPEQSPPFGPAVRFSLRSQAKMDDTLHNRLFLGYYQKLDNMISIREERLCTKLAMIRQ